MPDSPHRVQNITRSEDYKELYANTCQIRVSNFDFFFEFGKIGNVTDTTVETVSQVGIYLSPQQAKALFRVYSDNLTRYENDFGPIVIEPTAKK